MDDELLGDEASEDDESDDAENLSTRPYMTLLRSFNEADGPNAKEENCNIATLQFLKPGCLAMEATMTTTVRERMRMECLRMRILT